MLVLTRFLSEVEVIGRNTDFSQAPWVLCRYNGHGEDGFDEELKGRLRWINPYQDLRLGLTELDALEELPVRKYDLAELEATWK